LEILEAGDEALVPHSPYSGRERTGIGAATLMDFKGAEVKSASEVELPRCGADLLRMGADCRRRGMEMVLVRDGDFKFMYLTEVEAEKMAEFRARAQASKQQLPRSEVLEFKRDGDSVVVFIRYVSMERLSSLLLATRSHQILVIGLPVTPIPGLAGLHLPGFNRR
jgi:hypothetical protein